MHYLLEKLLKVVLGEFLEILLGVSVESLAVIRAKGSFGWIFPSTPGAVAEDS